MKSDEIIFLDVEDVIEIHTIAIEKYGGQAGIRDRNLLNSATYQPQQTFDGDLLASSIEMMAGTYAYHLAENQPFIDGNKRTAFASSIVFLKLNGWSIKANNNEVHQLFIDLAKKEITKDDLIQWYKNKIITL